MIDQAYTTIKVTKNQLRIFFQFRAVITGLLVARPVYQFMGTQHFLRSPGYNPSIHGFTEASGNGVSNLSIDIHQSHAVARPRR